MRLPDGPRHALAAGLAIIVFLGLYYGAALIWGVALGLAALSYGAVLLIVQRKRLLDEIVVSGTTTKADLAEAARIMDAAAVRLDKAAERVPDNDRSVVKEITDHLRSIRNQVAKDPEDFRRVRRFVKSYLAKMVTSVESYADLAEKSRGLHGQRLSTLASTIHGFVPTLAKIDAACLENDFAELEAQMSALDFQMKRG